jgi:hypothetical protein
MILSINIYLEIPYILVKMGNNLNITLPPLEPKIFRGVPAIKILGSALRTKGEGTQIKFKIT